MLGTSSQPTSMSSRPVPPEPSSSSSSVVPPPAETTTTTASSTGSMVDPTPQINSSSTETSQKGPVSHIEQNELFTIAHLETDVAFEHYDDEAHVNTKRVVLIAVDQSENSEKAIKYSIEKILDKRKDVVVLLNVRPVVTVPGPYGTSYIDFTDYLTQVEQNNKLDSYKLLREYGHKLKKLGFRVQAIALKGDPRTEILRKVEDLHGDMLIVGSRGLGALKRLFLGSTSDYLVKHSHCPILIVK